MKSAELEQYTAEELDVLIDATREDLQHADDACDAVVAHDIRCALDQLVTAREKLNMRE
ncbi:hypothetical protein HOR19_gp31 [Phage MedPE-SWcel-C56]|uniref:Uncharacterized protein n=1 Tax=Phage MedPE-SWcel-C56 TaxID=1871314 RepID=A0A1B1IY24_9CAUD|nr:hypothetical protein HOR19_gp31 [Phage MedPE-SWcel-C56]ANS06224.1 hypothetical protein [Phage MedPE-SWcel-C56]